MEQRIYAPRNLKRFVQDYYDGNLAEDYISHFEELNKKPIAELIGIIETFIYQKSHRLKGMTLPELRRWKRNRCTLSEEEKQAYASANGCTYSEFEAVALRWLEIRESRNNEKKIAKFAREIETLRRQCDQMVADGRAVKDGNCYVTTLSEIL